MQSKLFATILFGFVCLSNAPAHAQGRAVMGVLEWFGLFGRSAAADSRLLLMREYEVGGLAKNSLLSKPDYLSRSRDLLDLQRELTTGSRFEREWTARGVIGSDDFLFAPLSDPLDHPYLRDSNPYYRELHRLQLRDPTALVIRSDNFINSERVATNGTDAAKSNVGTDAAKSEASSLFKFSVGDGKLKIGTLKKYKNLEIEGGEINLYKWGAAGGATVLCNTIDCYKAARRAIIDETFKPKDVKEVLESIEKAKKPELDAD